MSFVVGNTCISNDNKSWIKMQQNQVWTVLTFARCGKPVMTSITLSAASNREKKVENNKVEEAEVRGHANRERDDGAAAFQGANGVTV